MSYQDQIQSEINSFIQSYQNQNQNQNQNPNYIPRNTDNNNNTRNNNKRNDNDIEYRDTINEKLNNLHLSLPTQQKATHTLDMNFITNNPQYQSQLNIQKTNLDFLNSSRKDIRDGMNNKMDNIMFQRFENPDIPSSVKVTEQQQSYFNQQPQNQNQNQNQNQTGKFNSRDEHNSRMQEFSSLPRALYQPTKHINNPHLSGYQNSYDNQYRAYSPMSSNPDFIIQHPERNNNNNNNNNNDLPMTMNYLPNTNESARMNFKETHNERLQSLSPLARTCAIPNSDYTKSIEQNITQQNLGRITKDQNNINHNNSQKTNVNQYSNIIPQLNNNRNKNINNSQNNWYLNNNLTQIGPPPSVFNNSFRPTNTRE